MKEIYIRDVISHDSDAIAKIYNPYILNTVITFEETVVTAEEILSRMEGITALGFPYLVMEQAGQVIGYAYANLWRTRAAYRHTVETSIYLGQAAAGKGLGTVLYSELLDKLRKMEVHVVLGGITLPNPASVALHEKLGFKKVAHYPQVGYKFGRWLDVGFWELVISD